ncbi:MAG: hypothetical protein KAI51_00995 [Candidatus Aenigmarchaeota archaeon]|nr:hypothetical protein [Candidatus Aenigmarchaeota archaeon]MCK5451987.1 hypothetical protein [Candidatus Aenigmarchaeota archaeon]
MGIDLIDDMQDPDTVIGFLYEMCFVPHYSDKIIHPEAEKYLKELEQYIINGNVGKYEGHIDIDPLFFQKNRDISMEIFPMLAANIRSNSDKDITITSGNYILDLHGYSTGFFRLREKGIFREVQPPFPIHPPEISRHRYFPEYETASETGEAFVKKNTSYKSRYDTVLRTISESLKSPFKSPEKAQTS